MAEDTVLGQRLLKFSCASQFECRPILWANSILYRKFDFDLRAEHQMEVAAFGQSLR